METLTQILASFDIFQVLIAAVPHLFGPLWQAFVTIWETMARLTAEQFTSHPGLISGSILFLLTYSAYTAVSKYLRRRPAPTPVTLRRTTR
jgi:hypothetical protein